MSIHIYVLKRVSFNSLQTYKIFSFFSNESVVFVLFRRFFVWKASETLFFTLDFLVEHAQIHCFCNYYACSFHFSSIILIFAGEMISTWRLQHEKVAFTTSGMSI